MAACDLSTLQFAYQKGLKGGCTCGDIMRVTCAGGAVLMDVAPEAKGLDALRSFVPTTKGGMSTMLPATVACQGPAVASASTCILAHTCNCTLLAFAVAYQGIYTCTHIPAFARLEDRVPGLK